MVWILKDSVTFTPDNIQLACAIQNYCNVFLWSVILTLRACFLKLFSFPILASLLHIFWPPLTFSTTSLPPFLTCSTTSTNLINGTQKSDALCRIKFNAVLSLFWLEPATPMILGKGNTSATHQSAWLGSLKPQIVLAVMGLHPFWTPINLLLIFPPYLLFSTKGGQKTINLFSHFHGLVLTPITSIWSVL